MIASVCGVKIDECVQFETTWRTSNGSLGQEFLLLNSLGYECGQYTITTGANASAPRETAACRSCGRAGRR
jgi:hypothetical protein